LLPLLQSLADDYFLNDARVLASTFLFLVLAVSDFLTASLALAIFFHALALSVFLSDHGCPMAHVIQLGAVSFCELIFIFIEKEGKIFYAL